MSPPTDPAATARVALITGADSRHGRAAADALRSAGWTVDPYDAGRAAGPVDALVLAGADEPEPVPFAQIDLATWQAAIDAHLRAAFEACRSVVPGMVERGAGSVIAITPASALNGAGAHHHAAAASAVIGLVKALAREVGAHGVVVNAVAPGPSTDPVTVAGPQTTPADHDAAGPSATDAPTPTPLGRPLTGDDLGATVRYLAEERHFFAGSVLAPSGGSHL